MESFVIKQILMGHSITRGMMNHSCRKLVLKGRVIDVGGARNPDYCSYMKQNGEIKIEVTDGLLSEIDFEKDRLPYKDQEANTVLSFNVLEHIYNHRFLVAEMRRILKSGGVLSGFVPFLINYHPCPHDYFRYTKESLFKIFEGAGFRDIEIPD